MLIADIGRYICRETPPSSYWTLLARSRKVWIDLFLQALRPHFLVLFIFGKKCLVQLGVQNIGIKIDLRLTTNANAVRHNCVSAKTKIKTSSSRRKKSGTVIPLWCSSTHNVVGFLSRLISGTSLGRRQKVWPLPEQPK